jgi:hypothetical protein
VSSGSLLPAQRMPSRTLRPGPKPSRSILFPVGAKTYTDADLVYLRDNYLTLAELCADRPETPEQVEALIDEEVLPRPPYVVEDGTGFFPADYFRLVDEAGGSAKLRGHSPPATERRSRWRG